MLGLRATVGLAGEAGPACVVRVLEPLAAFDGGEEADSEEADTLAMMLDSARRGLRVVPVPGCPGKSDVVGIGQARRRGSGVDPGEQMSVRV